MFERGEIVFFSFLRPLTAAFLNDPKADDVFQQAHRTAETDLVRETERARMVVYDGLRPFDAHERPCAGTQIGPVPAARGNGGDRRAGVVRATGDDFDLRQADFRGEIFFHRAEPGAGRADGREHFIAQAEHAQKFR